MAITSAFQADDVSSILTTCSLMIEFLNMENLLYKCNTPYGVLYEAPGRFVYTAKFPKDFIPRYSDRLAVLSPIEVNLVRHNREWLIESVREPEMGEEKISLDMETLEAIQSNANFPLYFAQQYLRDLLEDSK